MHIFFWLDCDLNSCCYLSCAWLWAVSLVHGQTGPRWWCQKSRSAFVVGKVAPVRGLSGEKEFGFGAMGLDSD